MQLLPVLNAVGTAQISSRLHESTGSGFSLGQQGCRGSRPQANSASSSLLVLVDPKRIAQRRQCKSESPNVWSAPAIASTHQVAAQWLPLSAEWPYHAESSTACMTCCVERLHAAAGHAVSVTLHRPRAPVQLPDQEQVAQR